MSLSTYPSPSTTEGKQYRFGEFCLRPDGYLFRGAEQVPLTPKELSVLRLLVSRGGEVVSLQELRDCAWGSVHVSSDSLPRCISSLRAHLQSEDCIQTLYKRGYRLSMPVTVDFERKPYFPERRRIPRPVLPRLVIVPFSTGEGVPAAFGPGIAEETMLRLSRSRDPIVEVMSRDSVFALIARSQTALEIGRRLNANLTLAGAVTALPQHYRLRAELINVQDGVQLWVEDFLVPNALLSHADARMAKRITARILGAYASRISRASQPDSGTSPVTSLAAQPSTRVAQSIHREPIGIEVRKSKAYAAFLEARIHWNTLHRNHMQQAIHSLELALELDPAMLTARVHLMHTYVAQANLGYVRASTGAELARRQAELALAQSPRGKSAHPTLGWIYYHHDRNMGAAEEAYARSQHPGYNPWTHVYRVRFALGRRRFGEAIDLLRAASRIDPHSPIVQGRLAWALYLAGDRNAAVQQAEIALSVVPGHLAPIFFCANILAGISERGGELADRAAALSTQLIQDAPSFDSAHAIFAYARARQGKHAEARNILSRLKTLSEERFVMHTFQIPALIELGELDRAAAELSVADSRRCPWLFELLLDPRLAPIHNSPEYQSLSSLPLQVDSESVA